MKTFLPFLPLVVPLALVSVSPSAMAASASAQKEIFARGLNCTVSNGENMVILTSPNTKEAINMPSNEMENLIRRMVEAKSIEPFDSAEGSRIVFKRRKIINFIDQNGVLCIIYEGVVRF